MRNRLRANCTPYPGDQMTDDLIKDDPPRIEWRFIPDDYGAARRALYAARMHLGVKNTLAGNGISYV